MDSNETQKNIAKNETDRDGSQSEEHSKATGSKYEKRFKNTRYTRKKSVNQSSVLNKTQTGNKKLEPSSQNLIIEEPKSDDSLPERLRKPKRAKLFTKSSKINEEEYVYPDINEEIGANNLQSDNKSKSKKYDIGKSLTKTKSWMCEKLSKPNIGNETVKQEKNTNEHRSIKKQSENRQNKQQHTQDELSGATEMLTSSEDTTNIKIHACLTKKEQHNKSKPKSGVPSPVFGRTSYGTSPVVAISTTEVRASSSKKRATPNKEGSRKKRSPDEGSHEAIKTESKTESHEAMKTESKTKSQEAMKTESKTKSHEAMKTESKTKKQPCFCSTKQTAKTKKTCFCRKPSDKEIREKPIKKEPSVTPSTPEEPSITVDPSVQASLIKDPSVQASLIKDPSVQASLLKDPSVQASLIQDPSVQASIMKDPSVQASIMKDPSVQASIMKDPSVQASIIKDPSVQESIITDPAVQESILKNPSVQASILKNPSVQASIIRNPSVKASLMRDPSVRASLMKDPSIRASMVRDPSVQASIMKDPSAQASMIKNPSVQASIMKDPSVQASVINDPAVQASLLKDPSVQASIMKDPSVQASILKNPSVQASIIKDPSVQASIMKDPSVQASIMKNPSVQASLLKDPSVQASIMKVQASLMKVPSEMTREPSVRASILRQPSTSKIPPKPIIRRPSFRCDYDCIGAGKPKFDYKPKSFDKGSCALCQQVPPPGFEDALVPPPCNLSGIPCTPSAFSDVQKIEKLNMPYKTLIEKSSQDRYYRDMLERKLLQYQEPKHPHTDWEYQSWKLRNALHEEDKKQYQLKSQGGRCSAKIIPKLNKCLRGTVCRIIAHRYKECAYRCSARFLVKRQFYRKIGLGCEIIYYALGLVLIALFMGPF